MDDYFAGSLAGTQVPAAPPSYPPPGAFPPPVATTQPFAPAPPYAAPAPPPFARQGWAPPPGSAPQGWTPPPPARSSKKLVVGIVGGVVLVLAVMVVAALQVFLKERSIAAHTTVSLPPTVLDMPRQTGDIDAQLQSLAQSFPGPGEGVVGAYGTYGERKAVVLAAKYPMHDSDRTAFLKESEREAKAKGFSLKDERAGSLGGAFRCGTSAQMPIPVTMCAFTDAGSYGVVMVLGGDDQVAAARSIREAVVRRT